MNDQIENGEAKLDLSALARPTGPIDPPPRSKLRIIVPLTLFLGFAGVLASTLTDLFEPVHSVSVVRPTRPSAEQVATLGEDSVAVQASGWIEPDPFSVHATALTDGVVKELLVQESDSVQKGQVLAILIDDDARIDRDAAAAELAIRESKLAEAQVRHATAQKMLDEALQITEAREVARAAHEGAKAATRHRAAAVRTGQAQVSIAADEVLVQKELRSAGTQGVRQVEIAEASLEEAKGRLDQLSAEAELAEAKVLETTANLTRADREFELRLEERQAVDVAAAQVRTAQGEVSKAQHALTRAELRLSRMEVRSPISGIVLELKAQPGMLLSPGVEGNHVCSLYDPSQLRVRVDVPQPDISRVFVGQRAEVDSEARRRRPYKGEVTRVVQKANLAKVTLEVHVRLLEPDGLSRPEMLAQVRLFGSESSPSGGSASESNAQGSSVFVPSRLVDNGSVWVVDAGGHAERRALELGGEFGEMVEVRKGLNLTDKLVDDGRSELSEGDRLKVEGGAQ